MKMNEFISPEKNQMYNPIDWFNFFAPYPIIFEGLKTCNMISDKEACFLNPSSLDAKDMNVATFVLRDDLRVDVVKENPFDIAVGSMISKFMLLTIVKFKGDWFSAMTHVSLYLMKNDIPYIRVGTDYYKLIKKEDRYGSMNILLKAWKKDEIKQDHNKAILNMLFKFDDFTILPNNKEFTPTQNNCYNLYSKFPHEAATKEVIEIDLPTTIGLMKHIFGDQLELGLKYMKILYENPRQILPVLSLVSTERETGKTTFLNWIQMIFGENSVLIAPTDLTSSFNSGYATKNIVMIDETVIEKSTSIEKLKSLATAKSISIQQKFVSQYSVPFFGKIIICTNKEKDFMRIDEEEIRFWVRKVKVIQGGKNTNIENDLFNEIPMFLKFLEQLPEIDFSKSRMVFTKEEISTKELKSIKEESKSTICKELEILIDDFFHNRQNLDSFEATAKDIKEKWFIHNNQVSISYIRKVLKEEMKVEVMETKKYNPFKEDAINTRTGIPFKFLNKNLPVQLSIEIKVGDIVLNEVDPPF
jgi:hypothetical protein